MTFGSRPARPARLGPAALAVTLLLGLSGQASAEDAPVPASPPRLALHRPGVSESPGAGRAGWGWSAAAGLVALAVLGSATVAARRSGRRTGRESESLRIVGRTMLGTRQAVYVLRAGDRLLIVGTGPGGPPSLLATMPATPEEPASEGGRS